jgi:hypothetical protein
MAEQIDSYNLGKVKVIISETEDPNRYHVDCNDGIYHSEFTVRKYEYLHYRRLMNQKIKNAYQAEHKK